MSAGRRAGRCGGETLSSGTSRPLDSIALMLCVCAEVVVLFARGGSSAALDRSLAISSPLEFNLNCSRVNRGVMRLSLNERPYTKAEQ